MNGADAAAAGEPERVSAIDVDALVARHRDRQSLTSGEIFAAFPQLEPDTAQLAAIYGRLAEIGIEVVDEIEAELRREDEERAGRLADPSHHTRTPPEPNRATPRAARGRLPRTAGCGVTPRRRASTAPVTSDPSAWVSRRASTPCACTSRRSARSRC